MTGRGRCAGHKKKDNLDFYLENHLDRGLENLQQLGDQELLETLWAGDSLNVARLVDPAFSPRVRDRLRPRVACGFMHPFLSWLGAVRVCDACRVVTTELVLGGFVGDAEAELALVEIETELLGHMAHLLSLDAMALAEDVATTSFDVAAGSQTYSSPSDAVTLFTQ